MPSLRNNLPHHLSGNICETEIASGVAVGQSFMIEAEQVQHRGVQIVNARAILNGLETELIRGAVNRAALHAAAREPDTETVVVVVAAELGLAAVAQFDRRRTAEFSAP